ncbi:MFS transporter [Microaerobacter geothermalis]|uniref:MFS transporter n=1 Tax=Microaerobacter geothermalis TaxID=674972 RepID=UPI001F260433|nr:MFS transporter [Microaerobacter geothermalis]MCF6093125.1 MFS transporter [Microaerobacter geothermalis]
MGIYSPYDIEQNKKFSIYNGAYSMIAQTLVASYLPLYAIHVLGATNQQVGWISSIPSLMAMIAMIPGAIWINRLHKKKEFTAYTALTARSFFLWFALIPYLPFTDKAWFLVILYALMNIPFATANLSWQSLIGDLIPDRERGQFFSNRNRFVTIVSAAAILLSGFVMDLFDKKLAGPYQVLFVFALLMGFMEVFYLLKHIEIVKRQDKRKKVRKVKFSFFAQMFKHRSYLFFLVSAIIFNFGWQMAWPLFTIYQINYANATALWISLFTVANQISQIISYRWWGSYADKWGNSTMLFIASAGLSSAPILMVLSTNVIYLTAVNLWTGSFVAGITMLLFNQLLAVSPEEDRTSFLANYNFIIAFIGFVSPQIGVWLLEVLNMFQAMAISTIIRLLGAVSFFLVAFYLDKKA